MNEAELRTVLESHNKWLNGENGSTANLKGANLKGANLKGANLKGANLQEANLMVASLQRANLQGANLKGANLQGADLMVASLQGASLWEANLWGANLWGANLWGANLWGADLKGANLWEANFQGANLQKTCLGPTNEASGAGDVFELTDSGRVVGYRTRKAGHIDQYLDGMYYSADFFSTADTECHPGLYLWPTFHEAREWEPVHTIIKVETDPKHVHKAGSKWRCRWFYVVGEVKDE